VTGHAGVLGGAVRGVGLAWGGGAVASGDAMVEWGRSVIDPHRLM